MGDVGDVEAGCADDNVQLVRCTLSLDAIFGDFDDGRL